MSPSLLHGDEDISRLHNILGTSIIPFDVGGVLFLEDGEGLLVNDKFPLLRLDCAMEFVMSRIIPEHSPNLGLSSYRRNLDCQPKP